jgi:hypothetical protein
MLELSSIHFDAYYLAMLGNFSPFYHIIAHRNTPHQSTPQQLHINPHHSTSHRNMKSYRQAQLLESVIIGRVG